MIELYTTEKAAVYRSRARFFRIAALLLGIGGLGVCIFLCTQVRTGNARALLFWVVGTAAGSGWLACLLERYGCKPAGREACHMEGILREEREEFTGILRVSPVDFQIPKSVRVRKLTLQQGEQVQNLSILCRLLPMLPPDGTKIRVRCVRNYITAFEVCHADR